MSIGRSERPQVRRGRQVEALTGQPSRGRSEVAEPAGKATGFTAKAPSPIRTWTTAARARKAGYSQPPFGALNTQPFGACTNRAPRRTGSRATETMRA